MDPKILNILVCPICKGPLLYKQKSAVLVCRADKLAYPIKDDIPVMLVEEATQLTDEEVHQ